MFLEAALIFLKYFDNRKIENGTSFERYFLILSLRSNRRSRL